MTTPQLIAMDQVASRVRNSPPEGEFRESPTQPDQALAEFDVPQPDPGRWAGQLADVARQLRTVIDRHRDIVPPSIGFLPGNGRALRCHERVLAIMGPAAYRTAGRPTATFTPIRLATRCACPPRTSRDRPEK